MGRYDYRSGYEHLIAEDLNERGISFDYEKEVLKFRSRVRNGICSKCDCKAVFQRRTYTPDFVILRKHPLGIDYKRTKLYVEAKGILDSKTRSKMRAVLKDNPDIDLRIMFDGKAHHKRGKENAAWCEKYGFIYTFGTIVPEDWL